MKPGFTIIELLITAAIATAVGGLLTNALSQIERNRAYVDRYTDLYSRAALVHNQLSRDISGAFIPTQADIQETTTAQRSQPGEERKAKSTDKRQKPIDKVFYSINQNKQLSILSCVTNNPMEVYWGEQVGRPHPKVARVIYRLQPDKKQKGSYVLMRQEGNELDFAKYKDKKQRVYKIIDGIKALTVEYVAKLEKQEQKTKVTQQAQTTKKTTKQKIERERKTFQEWKIEPKQQQEQKKQKKQVMPLIPHWMILRISLWSDNYKRAVPFEFVIPITSSLHRTVYPEEEKSDEQKKQNPKHRVIPRRQARTIRRVPGPQYRTKQMYQRKTKKFEVVQNRKGPPQVRMVK